MREHLRQIGMPDTWGTHVTFVVDHKNLRREVYKPLNTKNLHYPVTVNNKDELFTTHATKPHRTPILSQHTLR